MTITASADQDRAAPDQNRRLALCLGAHRSGTSLVTAALEALGAELALPHRDASEENLKGFFEHAEVVAIDEALLALAGSAWDDGLFDAGALDRVPDTDSGALQARATQVVAEQLRQARLAAVKDPRMCRLLPFWRPVLQAAGYADGDVRCVIVTRDPVEIALSQRTRCRTNPDFYNFGTDLAEGMVLWLSHIRQALRDCAGYPTLVVAYRDFLERPAELMGQIAEFLGTKPAEGAVDRFVSEFITESLWRSRPAAADVAEVEGAWSGLLQAERDLADWSGRTPDRDDLAPILAAMFDPAVDTMAQAVVARAYGRLSSCRRDERQEFLRTAHALDVAVKARDALAKSRAETVRDTEAVQSRLRQQITALEAGRNEARKVEGNLRERITGLEAGIADRDARLERLRTDQDSAIRQLAAAFERNGQDLAQTRAELDAARGEVRQARQDAERMAGDLDRLQSENDHLGRTNAAQADRLAEISAQLDQLREALGHEQQVTEAIHASRSWRATRPLRAAGDGARSLKHLPEAGLRQLNRAGRASYRRLKQTHPQTADALRNAIQPVLMRANMKVLGRYSAASLPPPDAGQTAGAFAFDYQQPRVYPPYRPLVTVIVPNYNHAAYLTQRLESIYAQTYDNVEVLLLDDCSSDDSRAVLRDFAARHSDRTRLLFNDVNSGGVFHQWEKGLAAARGELIWIAESDDWASPNFLETLVPFFQNEAVALAYARTNFMDSTGQKQIWSMEEYLHQFGPERWGRAWVETAPNIVRDVFSMVNIVPNVSSAVFRRFDRLDVLEIDQWRTMRTCGDWMFYLNAIRGGLMAYSPDAQNFYRIHDKNTSITSHKADQFYREHEEVAKCVKRHYRVPAGNLARMEANLRDHWKGNRDSYSDALFAECFSLDRIGHAPDRKPSLLMVSFAFCAGGGETFPIQLANEMKAIGYEVTLLDCAQEERLAGVRAKLANDIPVISNFPDLNRIVAQFDIDVIHSHHGWTDNTVLDLLPETTPAKTVITLHGFYETLPPRQLRVQLPRLLRRTGAMVYIAEKNLTAMQADGLPVQASFHRIDNAVSRTRITPVERSTLGIAQDAFMIVQVSRALPEKGWAEAIAAVTRAREISGRDIQLVLVGDGEARVAAEAAGLPAHVHMEGFRPNTQDYFAAADLGLLPSRFKGESFPLVVIESLVAGTPVLASDVGELRHMLTTPDGMAGVLFALDDWRIDVEALAGIIAALASDPEEMARLRARVPLAAERFDPRRMADSYDEVYRSVAASDQTPRMSITGT